MKKLLITLTITGLISFLFGNYIFGTYQMSVKKAIEEVTNIFDNVYMLQYGSYNNIDKAKSNDLSNYILQQEDKYYKVYVGVTNSYESAKKIKEVYKKLGNDIYVREKQINSLEFIDYVNNYEDKILNGSDEEILDIQNKVIEKYKELLLDE